MRNYIASKTDIRPENVMIMATHTHSGPPSDLTAPKAKEYLTRAAGAVLDANANLKTHCDICRPQHGKQDIA